MKRLILVAVLGVLATPHLARADRDWWGGDDDRHDDDRDHKKHGHVNGTELSVVGFASAVVICTAGVLILRRRNHKTV